MIWDFFESHRFLVGDLVSQAVTIFILSREDRLRVGSCQAQGNQAKYLFFLYFLFDLLWLRIDWPLGFFHGRQLQLIGSVDISCSHGDGHITGQLNEYVCMTYVPSLYVRAA